MEEKTSSNWACGEQAGAKANLNTGSLGAGIGMKLDHSCSKGRIGNRRDLDLGLANRKSFSRGQYPFCKAAQFNSLLSITYHVDFLQNKSRK